MAEAVLKGGCLCGMVRFELSASLTDAGYCHCTRCQRRTGTAASANAPIDSAILNIISGADLVKAYHPHGGWEKLFCQECGSQLFSRNPDDPTRMAVRLGVVDGDPGVRPQWHQFVNYAAVWEPIPDDGLPQYPESRHARTS